MKKENKLRKILTSKSFRYGTSSFIIVAIVLALFIVINITVPLLGIEWDLTPEGLYTLSDTSKQILDNLEDEVEIIGLMDPTKISSQSSYYDVIRFLTYYDDYDNITVTYVDPDTNVGYVSQLDPTGALDLSKQNFVVRRVKDGNTRAVKYYDLFSTYVSSDTTFEITDTGSKVENAFTSAISYVTRDSYSKVYFVLGHNEYSYFDGYITARDVMELNGYDVSSFDLRANMEIPADANILLIVNPTIDLLEEEVKLLDDFMNKGGSMMICLGAQETNEKYPNIQKFLDFYNIQYNYDRIKEYDTNSYMASNQYYIFPEIVGSEATLNVYGNISYLLTPNARSIRLLNKSKSFLAVNPLLRTSSLSKQEASVIGYDSTSGAAYIGASARSLATECRLVVLGSTDFMRDYILVNNKAYEADSSKFFIGLLNWLEGDYSRVNIEEKNYFVNILSITASQANFVAVLLYVLPALILLTGGIVYLKRRHL
ncbi:MAG TPA: GldG family protein [Clostridia bacterium]|nr:GldG family protein [Clostridia bacterium]HOR89749.1 GldG family protein [Clostridia bacterium]HPL08011.1 GldG family protein [Clostridia bacterium]